MINTMCGALFTRSGTFYFYKLKPLWTLPFPTFTECICVLKTCTFMPLSPWKPQIQPSLICFLQRKSRVLLWVCPNGVSVCRPPVCAQQPQLWGSGPPAPSHQQAPSFHLQHRRCWTELQRRVLQNLLSGSSISASAALTVWVNGAETKCIKHKLKTSMRPPRSAWITFLCG